eukprot:gene12069-25297_t
MFSPYSIFAHGYAVCIILLSIFHNANVNADGFTSDGNIQSLIFAQKSVISSPNHNSALSFRINDTCLLISIYKPNNLLLKRPLYTHKLNNVLSAIVGRDSDCIVTKNFLIDTNLEYKSKLGESLNSNILALKLADDAHERSLLSNARSLASNTIILGYESHQSNTPNIFKIDTSGNFFQCVAVAVGYFADSIDNWFNTQGISLIKSLITKTSNTSTSTNHSNTNTSVISTNTTTTLTSITFTNTTILQSYESENITNESSLFNQNNELSLKDIKDNIKDDVTCDTTKDAIEFNTNSSNLNESIESNHSSSSIDSRTFNVHTAFKIAWSCLKHVIPEENMTEYRLEVATVSNHFYK